MLLMKLNDLFISRQDTAFAVELATRFVRLFPVALANEKLAQPKVQARLQNVLSNFLLDVAAFQTERHLNWVSKALFANTLRWELIRQGYNTHFAHDLAKKVASELALPSQN